MKLRGRSDGHYYLVELGYEVGGTGSAAADLPQREGDEDGCEVVGDGVIQVSVYQMPPPPLYQVHNGRPCPQKTKRRKHQRNGPAFILYNQHLAFLGFSSFSLTGATQKLDFCSSEIDSQGAPIQHLGANMIIITYQRPQLQSWTDLLHRHLQVHPNTCLNAPRKWTNNCGRKHQRAANLEHFLPSRKAFKYQEFSERVKFDARER